MPTGYTAALSNGEVSFEEFVMQCARAMGALVMMRDDPIGAPIPESFPPSTYTRDALVKARAELAEVRSLSNEECERRALAEWEQRRDEHAKSRREGEETERRYNAMLAQVLAWEPPTPDHRGLKDFMVQQIEESKKFDCRHLSPYYEQWAPPAEPPTGSDWRRKRSEELAERIGRDAAECEREQPTRRGPQPLAARVAREPGGGGINPMKIPTWRRADDVPAEAVERLLTAPVAIPLARAMLCADCESIFEAEGSQHCPACGSAQSWSIGRALNRRQAS